MLCLLPFAAKSNCILTKIKVNIYMYSVKTGLNDTETKTYITALQKNISLPECFLKSWESYHYLVVRYKL